MSNPPRRESDSARVIDLNQYKEKRAAKEFDKHVEEAIDIANEEDYY